jgi:hypothetical protein
MKMQTNLFGTLWSRGVAGLGLLVLLTAVPAYSAVVNTTMDTLLPGGSNAGGIVIGDKYYSQFSYGSTGDTPIPASQVAVSITTLDNSLYTLEFTFGLDAFPNERTDLTIGYRLDVVNSTDKISKVGLAFNGTILGGNSGLTAASIGELVRTVDGSDLRPGAPISDSDTLGVFNDGVGHLVDNNTASFTVNPTSSLLFLKNILVSSRLGGDYAHISVVDNWVEQTAVPEPASLLAASMPALLFMRKRRRHIAM